MTEQVKKEVKELRMKRTFNSLWVLLLIVPVLFVLMRTFKQWAGWMTDTPPEQIADLGVDIVQATFVTMLNVAMFVLFATMMASFVSPQLKENSFGSWSRFGVVFSLVLLCCALVSNGIL